MTQLIGMLRLTTHVTTVLHFKGTTTVHVEIRLPKGVLGSGAATQIPVVLVSKVHLNINAWWSALSRETQSCERIPASVTLLENKAKLHFFLLSVLFKQIFPEKNYTPISSQQHVKMSSVTLVFSLTDSDHQLQAVSGWSRTDSDHQLQAVSRWFRTDSDHQLQAVSGWSRTDSDHQLQAVSGWSRTEFDHQAVWWSNFIRETQNNRKILVNAKKTRLLFLFWP